MDDRNLMQDILLLEKCACDLYMHGTIEAATKNVNQTFKTALNDSLTMQDDIYQKMSQKGWYTNDQAEQSKVSTLKQKFSNMNMQ